MQFYEQYYIVFTREFEDLLHISMGYKFQIKMEFRDLDLSAFFLFFAKISSIMEILDIEHVSQIILKSRY